MTDDIPPETMAAVLRKRLINAPLWLEVSGASMGATIPSGARVLVRYRTAPRRGEI